MCVKVLPYLLGKYYQLHTTNTTQTFIHKFIEKGNSQQSNNLKIYKIYKKQFSHMRYIQNVSNTFSWKRLINFIPIYSSQYVYAFFFLIEVYVVTLRYFNQ
jgi:hypothetical protein